MQHVIETGKRVLSVAIAATTIAFSVGVAAFISPATAQAASAGDLIKGTSLTTVYYYGYDGMRYTFPNEKTYFSWYADFSSVMTISDAALADITLAGNVVVRPGTQWIKVQSDPKTYAVSTDGSIHWIESEDVAVDLAGSDWASMIIDVPDVFFTDYTVGTSLMTAAIYDGAVYEDGGNTYLAWDGEMRMVTSAGMSDNNIWDKFVLDGTGIDDSALTSGSDVSGEELALVDAAQTEDGTSTATGDVTVSLSSSTAAGATLPKGANSVEVFSFKLSAGSEAASVDSVVATMTGVGATTNLTSVYLYENSTRLTDSRSVNSSTREVTFSNLGIELVAGESRTFTVRVEVSSSASAGDDIAFSIESEDDVVSSGDVGGSFPIDSNSFTIANASAGEVDVTKSGTIVNPTLGQQDALVGEFKLTANTEAAWINEVTLKVDNADDHDDFRLWDGSTELMLCDFVGNKLVTCDLSDDPFYISEGSNNVFSMTADVGGDANDTLKIYVDNAVDIVAIGGDFGFGMTIDINDSNGYDGTTCAGGSSDKCSYSVIQGGDITFAYNPDASDIRTNSQDQVLMDLTFTTLNDVTVKDLDFIVYGDDDGDNDATDAVDDSAGASTSDNDGLVNSGGANLTDIKVIDADTGATIWGPMELDSVVAAGDDADQTIDFTEDVFFTAGTTLHLALTADIDDTVTSGTEFGAALDISGFSAEDENGDAITNSSDVVPTSDLTSQNHEANSAALTFSRASSPASTTVVQGQQSVDMLGLAVVAGDSSQVTVTSLTISGYADDTNTSAMTQGGASGFEIENYISSCSLYEDTTLVSGPKGLATNGDVVFNSMNWVVDASESTELKLRCNFNITSDTDGTDVIAFDLQSDSAATTSADVVAQDEDSNSPTVTITKVGSTALGLNDSSNDTTMDAYVGITVAAAGSLTLAASSNTPSADFLLETSAVEYTSIGQFNFTATNESFVVDKVTVTEEAAEDMGNGTDAVTFTNNIVKFQVSYTGEDGTTQTASSSVNSNEATFSGMTFLVEPGQNNYLNVGVDVPSSDRYTGGSATSNERLEAGLSVDTTNDDQFHATGESSGTALDDDDVSAVETNKQFVVREIKPTLTVSSSSPTGSNVSPVNREFFRFNVAATGSRDLVMNDVLFKINSTDIAATQWNQCDTDAAVGAVIDSTDFAFYNMSEDGTSTPLDVDADWTILTSTGAACTTTAADLSYVRLALTTAEVIPAGTTYAYALWINVAATTLGPSAGSDDSVQVEIPAEEFTSSFLTASDLTESNLTRIDTVVSVTSGAAYAVGDVVAMDTNDGGTWSGDERMFVLSISSNDLTVIRGYMGSTPVDDTSNDAADDLDRLPGVFRWQDDGLSGTTTTGEFWGGYLVDDLTITGNGISF